MANNNSPLDQLKGFLNQLFQFDSLKHNLKTIKVFKSIADTIIAFVSQIEDFQKKLWEKKKFVLSTEWVITIDRLVEYIGEEALENIAFKASEDTLQKALEFDQYIPKSFLEFETKGSQSLVNTAAMKDPWDYKLKVWDGFTYDTEQAVDLVETSNYLIGLHMQKCITKEINGNRGIAHKYQFVYGHNPASSGTNKNILAAWRSVKDWSLEDYKTDAAALKEEFKAFAYDLLYINDQAHIEGYQPIEEVFRNKMLS